MTKNVRSKYDTDISILRDELESYIPDNGDYVIIKTEILQSIIEGLNIASCGDCDKFCINTKEMNKECD